MMLKEFVFLITKWKAKQSINPKITLPITKSLNGWKI